MVGAGRRPPRRRPRGARRDRARPRRRAGHLEHHRAALAARRPAAPPPGRPGHRQARAGGLADRERRRRHLRGRQHRRHRRDHPRRARPRLARRARPAHPSGPPRRAGAPGRRLARARGDRGRMTPILASTPALWYLARGSGTVSLGLLTLTVVLGITTSVRWATRRWPRLVVAGLHRNLSLLAVLHGLGIGSDHRQVWMLALDSMAIGAVAAAVWWRLAIGSRAPQPATSQLASRTGTPHAHTR